MEQVWLFGVGLHVHLEAASRSRSTDVAQRQDTREDAASKCAETQALAEPAVGLGLVCERVWCDVVIVHFCLFF